MSARVPEHDGSGESLYRSELASARERVQKLEEELRARGGPRKRPRPGLYILAGVGVSLLAMGVVAVVVVRGFRRMSEPEPMPPQPVTAPVAEPPSLHGAQWYSPSQGANQTPILVDVNGDGTRDLVGLAWDARNDEHALHAVAFDGKSHQMLWHSEGISTQWYSPQTGIHVDGEQVVVSDSRNEIRLIDLHTGKLNGLTLAPDPTYAHPEPPRDDHEDLRHATPTPRKSGFYPSDAHPAGDVVATVGWLSEGDHGDWLVGWKKKTKAIVYEVPLLRETDERAPRSATTRTFDDARVYTAFVSAEGKQVRIVTRSLATGEVAWSTDVPGTDEGAQFRSMRAEDGQLFLAVDGTLLVLDTTTGHEIARLTGF